MKTCKTLIALARDKVHTDRELADALGVEPPDVTHLKKGRPVSPEMAAKLCAVAGIRGAEAREWIAVAVTENPKNAGSAELLRRVLFGLGAASVALLLQAPNDAQAMTADQGIARIDAGPSVYYVH